MKPVFPLILFLLLFQQNRAQISPGAAELCTAAILQKTNLSYRVQQNELENGKVIPGISGEVTLIRNTDTIFGFQYRVKTGIMEILYDGKFGFIINNETQRVRQVNPILLRNETAFGLILPELIIGFGKTEKDNYSAVNKTPDEIFILRNNAKYSSKTVHVGKKDYLPQRMEINNDDLTGKKKIRTIVTAIGYDMVPEGGIVSRLIELLDTHLLEPLDSDCTSYSTGDNNALIGREAPDFRLPDFNGNNLQLSDFRGKLVLLNFWEPWCGPCRMSISYLQEFITKLNTDDLVILNLTKDNIAFSRKLIQDRKIWLPNLISNEAVNKAYDVYVIPQYYLVDRKGKIIYLSKEGYEKKMEELILHLLKY